MKTLNECLRQRAQSSKAQVEFLEENLSLNYSQIFSRASNTAFYLKERGIKKGERVGVLFPTGSDFYSAFFGVLLSGGVPFALSTPARFGDMIKWRQHAKLLLKIAKADKVILPNKFKAWIIGLAKALTLPSLSENQVFEALVEPSDEAFVQFSSGTTGIPKLISISHQNILSNCQSIILALKPYDKNSLTVSWLPLFHDMGLIGGVMTTMVADTNLCLLGPQSFLAKPFLWLKAISEKKAQITMAPNFAFALCCKRITPEEQALLNLSSLKVALCGGEAVIPSTVEKFVKQFHSQGLSPEVVTPVYGLAEATLAVSFSDIRSSLKPRRFCRDKLERDGIAFEESQGVEIFSVGKPLSTVEVSIYKEGREVQNQVGSLFVRGPSVGKDNQWVDTGDLGFFYGGQLYIYGRKKEIIIINGRNIDPTLVEVPLNKIEQLRKGHIVALGVKGVETEELWVFAEVKNKALTSSEREKFALQIKEQVLQNIQLRVERVFLLNPGKLPKTSSGKIRRTKIREMILMGKKDFLK